MFIRYRTRAVFFKKENLREADKLFTVYTEKFGKILVLGKSIRKIKSKLAAGAQLFCLSEIEFIQGRAYKTLTDVILINKFEKVLTDYQKLELAYEMSDNLNSFLPLEQKDLKIWQLLLSFLKNFDNFSLNCQDSCFEKHLFYYYFFLWNFFSALGYKPQLYSCLICKKRLCGNSFWFLTNHGSIVCKDCFREIDSKMQKEAIKISPETIKVLRVFLESKFDIIKKIKVRRADIDELKVVSTNYALSINSFQGKQNKI